MWEACSETKFQWCILRHHIQAHSQVSPPEVKIAAIVCQTNALLWLSDTRYSWSRPCLFFSSAGLRSISTTSFPQASFFFVSFLLHTSVYVYASMINAESCGFACVISKCTFDHFPKSSWIWTSFSCQSIFATLPETCFLRFLFL